MNRRSALILPLAALSLLTLSETRDSQIHGPVTLRGTDNVFRPSDVPTEAFLEREGFEPLRLEIQRESAGLYRAFFPAGDGVIRWRQRLEISRHKDGFIISEHGVSTTGKTVYTSASSGSIPQPPKWTGPTSLV